jgi:hypothetical protein
MQNKDCQRSSDGIGKSRARILLVLLAIASAGGYWFLGGKIEAGKKQIAAGQENLVVGMITLEKGRTELENGQQRLSKGNEKYREAKQNLLLVWTDKLLKSGGGFKEARKRIVEGERKISDGEERISVGERRMDAGKQELLLGGERLRLAGAARVACAVGAVLFASIAIARERPGKLSE